MSTQKDAEKHAKLGNRCKILLEKPTGTLTTVWGLHMVTPANRSNWVWFL